MNWIMRDANCQNPFSIKKHFLTKSQNTPQLSLNWKPEINSYCQVITNLRKCGNEYSSSTLLIGSYMNNVNGI
jgi:hypothetical protein